LIFAIAAGGSESANTRKFRSVIARLINSATVFCASASFHSFTQMKTPVLGIRAHVQHTLSTGHAEGRRLVEAGE
jgi:hypothetical protein